MESAEYNKVIQEVNSPIHQKEDASLILGASCNWPQMLYSAPASIAVLGQVMLVAGQKDFSLVKGGSNQTFNHIRNPESFKASLVQLANEGWRSFNAANTNMDQIRLHTLILPDHMKTVMQTLMEATNQEAEVLLPKQIALVQRVPEECKRLAEDVEKQFISTMELICELYGASMAAKGAYDEEYQQIKASIKVAKERQTELEERKKQDEEELQKMQKLVDAHNKSVKEAIDSIPTGMNAFAMSMLESSMSTASMLISMRVSKLVGGAQVVGSTAKEIFNMSQSTPTTAEDKAKHEDSTAGALDASLILVSAPFENIATLLQPLCKQWKKDGKITCTTLDELRAAYALSTRLITTLESEQDVQHEASYDKVLDACVKVKDLTKAILEKENRLADEDREESAKILKDLGAVIKMMNKLSQEAKLKYSTTIMQGETPKLSSRKEGQNKELGALETASRNAFYKAEQAKAILEHAQAREEQASKNMRQNSENLHKVMMELSSLNLDEINFTDIKEVLKKGLSVIACLHQEWSNLVRLFASISNIVKAVMYDMEAFVTSIESQGKLKLKNVPVSDFQRDQIYVHMMTAHRVNFVVNQLSSAYCEISHGYIMPGVSSLNSLLCMDPVTDRVAIQQKQAELRKTCEAAKAEIMRRGDLQSQAFSEKIKVRMQQIETKMSPLFRALPEAEKKEIQEDFKKVQEEVTQPVEQVKRASEMNRFYERN